MSRLCPSASVDSDVCDVCQFSKQTHLPFINSFSIFIELLELVHFDLWGPAPVDSYDGYKYFVLFIDDFSRATWLYLLKSKTEVTSVFKDFHTMVFNQFGAKIKTFRYDNGTKYAKGPFSKYHQIEEIIHQQVVLELHNKMG